MIQSSRELLLALLLAKGHDGNEATPIRGITKVEKLAFLAGRAPPLQPVSNLLGFRPDNFGPFSERLQDDLEYLRTLQLIEFRDSSGRPRYDDLSREDAEYTAPTVYCLTETGKILSRKLVSQLTRDEQKAIEEIKRKFNHLTLDQLIGHVYRTSEPYWTSESIIADRYLQ